MLSPASLLLINIYTHAPCMNGPVEVGDAASVAAPHDTGGRPDDVHGHLAHAGGRLVRGAARGDLSSLVMMIGSKGARERGWKSVGE